MTEAERIWHKKSNDELLQAASELDTYTEAGQRIIRAELLVRGLEDPVAQAGLVSSEARTDVADAEPQALRCLRCHVELRFVGARSFHEGTHWGAIGELGHLFENSESFNTFVCPKCGHVELFVDRPGGDSSPA